MYDPCDPFCCKSMTLPGAPRGPLAGLSFAAKDLFDIAQHVTGAGNPDWLATHAPAPRTAPVVQKLVDAGATMAGKTHTDELSRGLFGENAHYGTPVNPKAADRVPGGSSSGSAVAVASGIVDFALGTDTGGSVRAPASFCGLYGIRPTHGRLAFEGVVAQAPSFDTIGWLTAEAGLLAQIAALLIGSKVDEAPQPPRLLVAADAFALAEPATFAALQPSVERLGQLVGDVVTGPLSDAPLSQWREHQSALQGREAWVTFADWIDKTNPRLSFEVAEAFLRGARVDEVRWLPPKSSASHVAPRSARALPTAPSSACRQHRSRRRSAPSCDQPERSNVLACSRSPASPECSAPPRSACRLPKWMGHRSVCQFWRSPGRMPCCWRWRRRWRRWPENRRHPAPSAR
jgi:amidase